MAITHEFSATRAIELVGSFQLAKGFLSLYKFIYEYQNLGPFGSDTVITIALLTPDERLFQDKLAWDNDSEGMYREGAMSLEEAIEHDLSIFQQNNSTCV